MFVYNPWKIIGCWCSLEFTGIHGSASERKMSCSQGTLSVCSKGAKRKTFAVNIRVYRDMTM